MPRSGYNYPKEKVHGHLELEVNHPLISTDKGNGKFMFEIRSGILNANKLTKKATKVISFNDKHSAVEHMQNMIKDLMLEGFELVEGEKIDSSEVSSISRSQVSLKKSIGRMTNLTEEDHLGKRTLNFSPEAQMQIKGSQKKLKSAGKLPQKMEGDQIFGAPMTEEKPNRPSSNIQEAINDVRMKLDLDEVEEVTAIDCKQTPKKINDPLEESVVSAMILTPPKVDFRAIAKFNTVKASENYFLDTEQIEEVFNKGRPRHIPDSSFKGVYLERKVFGNAIEGMPADKGDEVFTEYYSLQIDQEYCYFEYGVLEESGFLRRQLHETLDFIEAYCLVNQMKHLKVEIGFEEKSEKMVTCLSTKLVSSMKKQKSFFFTHDQKIEGLAQSAKKSIPQILVKDLEVNEINLPEQKNLAEVDVENKNLENDPQNSISDEPEEQELEDDYPNVDVRLDLGQSDLSIIYDKNSHSNPLFYSPEFNPKTPVTEIIGSINLDAREEEIRQFKDNETLTSNPPQIHPLGSVLEEPFPFKLPERYNQNFDPSGWYYSEKLDGVRCQWTGKALYTRDGIRLGVPEWFVRGFPKSPLDGELYIDKGRYEELASFILNKKKKEKDWINITFVVLDAPAINFSFSKRLEVS